MKNFFVSLIKHLLLGMTAICLGLVFLSIIIMGGWLVVFLMGKDTTLRNCFMSSVPYAAIAGVLCLIGKFAKPFLAGE